MTHIPVQEHLDGKVVDWMDKVSGGQYGNLVSTPPARGGATPYMRVGILGSGLMGGKLGTIWARAGLRWYSAMLAASGSSKGSHARPRARRGTAHRVRP